MKNEAFHQLCISFSDPKPIIHDDSRLISPNGILLLHKDNLSFLQDALQSGAKFVLIYEDCIDTVKEEYKNIKLCHTKQDIKNLPKNDIGGIIIDTNTKHADLLKHFYNTKVPNTIAVTGTNGKTSITSFVKQALTIMGDRCIGIESGNIVIGNDVSMKCGLGLTTPSLCDMHKISYLGRQKYHADSIVFEASSHGMHQDRIGGLDIRIAAFTNLSQDHLDYHKNMASYFECKKLLFSRYLSSDGIAVLNADIPEYGELSQICKDRQIKVISYGNKGEQVKVRKLTSKQGKILEQEHIFIINNVESKITVPFAGLFQIDNLACAIAILIAMNKPLDDLANIVQQLKAPIGRMQNVSILGKPSNVYIDYAHTPHALSTILSELEQHKEPGGRIILVFGCGGERDIEKRPIMGRIASEISNIIFITDDNPRTEDTSSIRQDIINGIHKTHMPKVTNVNEGRAHAIQQAISISTHKDIVIIAGKGHEEYQIINQEQKPFSDRCVAVDALLTKSPNKQNAV